jgi:hydroxymethylglutaryl-CoA lyase
MGWPKIEYTDETMREGMQIESPDISTADKVRLLDALSATGLPRIVVGSFVSPKWTPQMAEIDQIVEQFTPHEGVVYTALALNEKGRERARAYSPKLTVDAQLPRTMVHLCDVFTRRNVNVSQEQEIARWPAVIDKAVAAGATEAMIALNAAWGSNWVGEFSEDQRMDLLGRQYDLWTAAGVAVTSMWIGDPMSWNMPHVVESQLQAVRQAWPSITSIGLHLHNARGMAPVSMYAAMRALDERFTLRLDGTVGGMGGCPYCGNGQVTRMAPTEDMVHMWQRMGIDLGVDLDKLIEAAWLAEEIVGHKLWGAVSKAGAMPRTPERLYPMDLPFIETEDEARHFALGRAAVRDEALNPWKEPITSPQRDAVEAGRPVEHTPRQEQVGAQA